MNVFGKLTSRIINFMMILYDTKLTMELIRRWNVKKKKELQKSKNTIKNTATY